MPWVVFVDVRCDGVAGCGVYGCYGWVALVSCLGCFGDWGCVALLGSWW